jgi:hypothetical protein
MKQWSALWRTFAGGVVWLLIVACWHPSAFETGWANALLLLAPLVQVPLGLSLAEAPDRTGRPCALLRAATHLQLPAALLLALSFALPAGAWATLLSTPWLGTTALIASAGLVRAWRRGVARCEELCLDAGLAYLGVGGAWTVLARGGVRPLDFEPVVVLLTAIHFHHAGFILPLLTALAGRTLGGASSRAAAIGVVIGIPLVAAGITTTQIGLGPLLECVAACWTALAGLTSAWLHLRLSAQRAWHSAVRAAWVLASLSLAGGMILAAAYGLRFYAPVAWLDLAWMRALHGTANALGFGLVGLLAWHATRHAGGRETAPDHQLTRSAGSPTPSR